ncbi:MAG: 3-methyl-2-oxobutanoate hydroxymethyltransferase, partial [Cyanobacteria bacterium J06638_38]
MARESPTKIKSTTAWDYSLAQVLDQAGVDLILVGDSLAMVGLGHS